MKKSFLLLSIIILISAFFISGCGMKDNNLMNSNGIEFIKFSPENDAKDVATNEKISLTFAKSVDPNIIEQNFVIISQKDMIDSLCPISKDMGHSDMGNTMMNMEMMKHMKDVHKSMGKFNWNSDFTMCEFIPDLSLSPDTDYMMFVDRDMVSYMGEMMKAMGDISMMLSNCPCHKNNQTNTMRIHFRTELSAGNKDEHESHHN